MEWTRALDPSEKIPVSETRGIPLFAATFGALLALTLAFRALKSLRRRNARRLSGLPQTLRPFSK
jgi:hypothetical protein